MHPSIIAAVANRDSLRADLALCVENASQALRDAEHALTLAVTLHDTAARQWHAADTAMMGRYSDMVRDRAPTWRLDMLRREWANVSAALARAKQDAIDAARAYAVSDSDTGVA